MVNEDGSLGYKLDGADTVYPFKSDINATIAFNLTTWGQVNYDGDVISSSQTARITMTIKNGKISLNRTSVSSTNSNTSKSNGTSATISSVSLTIN